MKKSFAWPYVEARPDLRSPLRFMPLLPGDVVLTTRSGVISAAIRRAADVPVSHAALMVTSEWAMEARDPDLEVNDSTGGVYLCSRDELISVGLVDHIVVRRPPSIDARVLQRWALDQLMGERRFASAGLAMMPALRAFGQLHSMSARAGLRNRLSSGMRRRHAAFAEAVADGRGLIICAELVYRGLLTAGCDLDLNGAFFSEAMATLPQATPDALVAEVGDPASELERLARARTLTPGSANVASDELPGVGRVAWANLRRRWSERHSVHLPGDKADLVTPGDLLRLPPLATLAEFRSRRGSWERVA